MGEAGLPLLERGFETGNQMLQKRALSSAVWIGEAAIPMLKRVLKNKNLSKKIKTDTEETLQWVAI
ncbi:MAG: hypothetical protein OXM55_04470 [Bdellovibrionales bacterium]|nr:hypothetical protein [Bdellovibrionales bacterium]